MECAHKKTEMRYITIRDGRRQNVMQCLSCGKRIGPYWPKGANDAHIAPFDVGIEARFAAETLKNAQGEKLRKHDEYENYIRTSAAWQVKRRRVLSRAGGLCEACLQAPASEVHHDNYSFLFEEVLWQLHAVCHACHQKIHGRLF